MSDSKRTKLEKAIEAFVTRYQGRQAQLRDSRAALAAICEDLATENDNSKWENLVTMHHQTTMRIDALIDEIRVLEERTRIARLNLNDYDLAAVNAEISGLLTENQGIRTKANALREDFRRLCAKPQSDMETKQKAVDVKNELSQLELAGQLTTRQVDAAKRRRDQITEEREGIAR